jgi:hypothetical protein
MSHRGSFKLGILWPILIAWVALAARLVPTPRTIDDAFITFRYARNIVTGSGFVYNPGERVLGTTTPLYTLLMAGVARSTGTSDYPHLAWLINALADTLTCLLLIRLGARVTERRSVGLATGALWAIAPMSVTFAIGGMETSVFMLLLVLSASLYLEAHTGWAALTSALLLLTRPDGLIFVGLLLIDIAWQGWRRRRVPWREAMVFLLMCAPWALFATAYFGSPIPHSIAAKSLAYRQEAQTALVRLIQHYSTPFFEDLVLGPFWRLGGVFIYFGLCLVGALAVLRRHPRAWPLAVYPWLYMVVFSAANPLIFRWYLAPPLPFYFLFILAGVAKIAADLRGLRISVPRLRALSQGLGRGLLPAIFSLVLFFSLAEWTLHPDHGPQSPAPQMAWHQLELLYTAVAKRLVADRAVTPRTVIAAGDVGALGYYTQARILDTVGLMSPQATAYYPLDPALYTINYAVAPRLILDYQPDFVILLEVYGRTGLFKDPTFLAEYALYSDTPTDIYGSTGLLVYQRR